MSLPRGALAIAVVLALAPPQLCALEQLATMEASAVIVPRCRVESPADVSFGELDPGRALDVTVSSTVRVACTRGTTYRVLFDNGRAYDSERASRAMRRNTGERLPYALIAEGDRGIATGWQRPLEVRLRASIRSQDYVNLPGGTYEDVLRISIEY